MGKNYQFNQFEVRPSHRQVLAHGTAMNLGARAFDLLVYLIENRDRVVAKSELLRHIWPGLVVEENNLSVHLVALRKLFGTQAVITVKGRGLKFGPAVREPSSAAAFSNRRAGDDAAIEARTASLPAKPSIAVLAFDNLGGDAGQAAFCDGVTEDIITELSRFQTLFVVARNSSFTYKNTAVDIGQVSRELGVRYVVEGSIRRLGGRVRITAQLIDAISGNHVWAEKYDRFDKEIFDIQDEVVQMIVATLAPQIDAAEILRARTRPGNLSAYEIAVQAYALAFEAFTKSDAAKANNALELARSALKLDPDSLLGLNAVAFAQYQLLASRTSNDHIAAFDEGIGAANRGIALARHSWCHSFKAFLLVNAPGGPRWEEARREAEIAHEINPQDCGAMGVCGWIRAHMGEAQSGIDLLERSVRLNPRDPYSYTTFIELAMAYFRIEKYEESLEWALRSASSAPDFVYAHLYAATSNAALGNLPAAGLALQTARQLAPDLVTQHLQPHRPNPRHPLSGRYNTWLRVAAGLGYEEANPPLAIR